MNKFGAFGALGLVALAMIAGSAHAGTLIQNCNKSQAFTITTPLFCPTANGNTNGSGVGSNPASTATANLTKATNAGDKANAIGKNGLGQIVCGGLDRNPSVASTNTDTGCAGSVTMFVSVDNRL
jgi:hypothetical protein